MEGVGSGVIGWGGVRERKGFRLMLVSSLGVWACEEHRQEGAHGGADVLGAR